MLQFLIDSSFLLSGVGFALACFVSSFAVGMESEILQNNKRPPFVIIRNARNLLHPPSKIMDPFCGIPKKIQKWIQSCFDNNYFLETLIDEIKQVQEESTNFAQKFGDKPPQSIYGILLHYLHGYRFGNQYYILHINNNELLDPINQLIQSKKKNGDEIFKMILRQKIQTSQQICKILATQNILNFNVERIGILYKQYQKMK